MIYTVTNMWPTDQNPALGSFVKRVHESLDAEKTLVCVRFDSRRFIRTLYYLVFYFKQLILYFRSTRQDIFVVHFVSLSGIGIILARLIFGRRGEIVGFCHGSDILPSDSKIKNFILRLFAIYFLKASDRCICPSIYLKCKLRDLYRYDKKCFVSPSGGVPAYMYCNDKIRPRPFEFGYIGRICKDKGILEFLDAMIEMKNTLSKDSILLVGPVDSSLDLKKYMDLLPGKIKVVPEVNHQALSKYYRKIKFFIYATHRDSLGLVGLEAMANACIVITNCSIGPGSYVTDGQSGICVKNVNKQQVKNAVQRARCMNYEELELISENAFRVASKFNETEVRGLLNKYLEANGELNEVRNS